MDIRNICNAYARGTLPPYAPSPTRSHRAAVTRCQRAAYGSTKPPTLPFTCLSCYLRRAPAAFSWRASATLRVPSHARRRAAHARTRACRTGAAAVHAPYHRHLPFSTANRAYLAMRFGTGQHWARARAAPSHLPPSCRPPTCRLPSLLLLSAVCHGDMVAPSGERPLRRGIIFSVCATRRRAAGVLQQAAVACMGMQHRALLRERSMKDGGV